MRLSFSNEFGAKIGILERKPLEILIIFLRKDGNSKKEAISPKTYFFFFLLEIISYSPILLYFSTLCCISSGMGIFFMVL